MLKFHGPTKMTQNPLQGKRLRRKWDYHQFPQHQNSTENRSKFHGQTNKWSKNPLQWKRLRREWDYHKFPQHNSTDNIAGFSNDAKRFCGRGLFWIRLSSYITCSPPQAENYNLRSRNVIFIRKSPFHRPNPSNFRLRRFFPKNRERGPLKQKTLNFWNRVRVPRGEGGCVILAFLRGFYPYGTTSFRSTR